MQTIKRPLLCGCLALAAVIVLWQRLVNPPPWESPILEEMCFLRQTPLSQEVNSLDELPVTVTGQIYKKEVRTLYGQEVLVLYLKSVAVSSDTQSRDETSVSYHAEHKIQDRLIAIVLIQGFQFSVQSAVFSQQHFCQNGGLL